MDADRPWGAEPADPYGVRALFAEGRHREARAVITAHVNELARSGDPEAGRVLGEMVLDAEWLWRAGHRDEARAMVEAITRLDPDDDLLAPAICHAREAHGQWESGDG